MPLDKALVHRPARAADRAAFAKLPEAAVAIASPPTNLSKLAKVFAEAAARPAAFKGESPVVALATGPMLDGPDRVVPRRLVRRGERLELEIAHTAVRRQGAQLRRNIRWRPMAQVPLALPAGRYRLEATWRAVASLPDGKPLEGPAQTCSVEFEIRERDSGR
jgi:hypothetical protein